MNRNEIWSALIDGFTRLGFSAMEKTADELGLEPGWLTWLWAIVLFANETFSTETYMHIRPYGSARVNETRFTSAAIQGIDLPPKSLVLRIFRATSGRMQTT